ncbi:hypothetical protein KEM63_04220 [Halopseudomonas nanhaiensis]|uniref:LPS-assembly lipoprotein LptE n=1 Tax=Halopseudomonas nanhaiensis TaxID=2830842 RepID=UPI001CC150A0|nr:LPS assembly lipoprotein LptE [Halopseudomonas nanhaiensis]UAW99186.1 hypothetical protein KEM63_04220 [Halopseudomonas nanhaiensis]
MAAKSPRFLLGCVLGLTLLTAGCGFQLRGTGVDSVDLDRLHLTTMRPDSVIYRETRQSLESDGVTITASAPYHLQLLDERTERVAVSYTGRATAAEIELRSSLTFIISDSQGRPLVGPETLGTQRVYVNDRNNVVGTNEEEALLQGEMQRDLTRQLLFRLSSLTESELSAREQALDRQMP